MLRIASFLVVIFLYMLPCQAQITDSASVVSELPGVRPNKPLSGTLFPYALNWKVDVPIAATAVAVGTVSIVLGPRHMTPQQVVHLDKMDLWGIDRFSVGRADHIADKTSDWLQYGMVAGGAVSTAIFSRMKGREFATLFTMYVETFATNFAFSYAFKNAISRPRPYVYNDGYGVGATGFDNSDFQSMISAHASTCFMSAVFISKTFSDLHPHSKFKPLVWTVTLSAATAASVLRLFAGEHFTTDIIAGAAVGAGIGYLVPWLHKKTIWLGKQKRAQMKLSPYTLYGAVGISSRIHL